MSKRSHREKHRVDLGALQLWKAKREARPLEVEPKEQQCWIVALDTSVVASDTTKPKT